jgi:L-lactate dehydrogenase
VPLILSSVATELVLVDVKVDLRDNQVRDLSDVTYSRNSATSVRAGTHQEAGQCDIVVITAGSKYSLGNGSSWYTGGASLCDLSGQPSIDHMYRNIATIRSAIKEMKPFRSDTILLVVANPVDLLTSLAQELSELLARQVLGSGTFLDSVRLRGLLAAQAGVRAYNSYVLVQTS